MSKFSVDATIFNSYALVIDSDECQHHGEFYQQLNDLDSIFISLKMIENQMRMSNNSFYEAGVKLPYMSIDLDTMDVELLDYHQNYERYLKCKLVQISGQKKRRP